MRVMKGKPRTRKKNRIESRYACRMIDDTKKKKACGRLVK